MTSTLEPTRPGAGRPAPTSPVVRWSARHVPLLLAGLVVLLRLPFVAAAPGADEAGFLMVARQWRPGSSLYGDYWVDRPPLLITVFRVAAELGGLVPLRLVGAAASALVVLAVARVTRQVVARRVPSTGGEHASRAGAWAALVAAGLCVSPVVGASEVNGELLAAPFVVWGMSALLAALDRPVPSRTRARCVVASGAAIAAAVLVKQNLVDGAVFAAVVLLLGLVRREVTPRSAVRLGVGLVSGAVACTTGLVVWSLLHGTSPVGVYDAMYPFRLAADAAMAASGNAAPAARLVHLLGLLALSGVPVLVLVCAAALARRGVADTAAWALVAMLVFAGASIYLGGNYWSHYLVELVVPVSVLGGLAVGSRAPGSRAASALVGAVGVLAWALVPPAGSSPGSDLGRAIARAAGPGDGIVAVYGHADVDETSGLSSPYPYLWSLPLKVRDPHGSRLAATLAGPLAPTWFVTFAHVRSVGFDAAATARALQRHYHRIAELGGHTVYLHDGVDRPVPALTS